VLAPAGTCGVTFVAPDSGTGDDLRSVRSSTTRSPRASTIASAQVRTGSVIGAGTIVVAATDDMAPYISGTDGLSISREFPYSGLTPGATYNGRNPANV